MNKYRNIKTVIDGKTFDSKKEANRYGILRLLEKQGLISELRCQVPFKMYVTGLLICTYKADFCYVENGKAVVEDVKGFITKEFKLKKRLMKALFDIEIKIS